MVQKMFGKDLHGLREKDINHKDKQNYDAVLHMTSDSVLSLLTRIPDATGTLSYLNVLRCAIDSCLDKKIARLRKYLVCSVLCTILASVDHFASELYLGKPCFNTQCLHVC